jgi:peptidoglycan/LPS O-acetylase OafA/YrhL
LGLGAYQIRKNQIKSDQIISDLVLIMIISLLAAFIFYPKLVQIFYDDFIATSFMTFALIIYGNSRSILYRFLFVNPISLYIGTISYSLYLSHFPIINLINKIQYFENLTVKFLVVLLLTILISTATYFTIERTGVKIGRHFENQK